MEYGPVRDTNAAVDAERGLLGILIRFPEQLDGASRLRKSDFTGRERQGIYAALTALGERGEESDIATLAAEVKRLTSLEADVEIIECVSAGVSSKLLRQYMRMVKEASVRRRVASISRRLEECAADPAADMPQVITKAIDALRDTFDAGDELPVTQEVMGEGYMMLTDMQTGDRRALPSGLDVLDNEIKGFYPSELTIVGARTGSGKSAFAISAALAAAASGAKVLFVSTEMSLEQLGVRLLANRAVVPMSRLRSAEGLTDQQWQQLNEMLTMEDDSPIRWLTGERELTDIFARARALRADGRCDMLIVDYLQQLEYSGGHAHEEWLRLGRISVKLKQLAVDLKIPVVATAQLNRMNEGAAAPGLDSLRGSGSLEQDADNVILISAVPDRASSAVPADRKHLYDICREKGMKLTLFSISKQRQGTTGRLLAGFDGEHMRFVRL